MAERDIKDHFAELELEPGASEDDIRKSFRRLAKHWHPDKNPTCQTGEKMKEINAAYEFLLSKDRREILERNLRRRERKPAGSKKSFDENYRTKTPSSHEERRRQDDKKEQSRKKKKTRYRNQGGRKDDGARNFNWTGAGAGPGGRFFPKQRFERQKDRTYNYTVESDEDESWVRSQHCGKLYQKRKRARHQRTCGEHYFDFTGSERESSSRYRTRHQPNDSNNEGIDVHTLESGVRGFHVYREIWKPRINEKLRPMCERDNAYDMFAVALLDELSRIVGHVPREFSKLTTQFIEQGGNMKCKILKDRFVRGKGLEIPCLFIYTGPTCLVRQLKVDLEQTVRYPHDK